METTLEQKIETHQKHLKSIYMNYTTKQLLEEQFIYSNCPEPRYDLLEAIANELSSRKPAKSKKGRVK